MNTRLRHVSMVIGVMLLLCKPLVAASPDLDLLREYVGRSKKPLTWVFTGDSITLGAKHLRSARSYPEILSERIRYEIGRRRDLVINSGVDGENISGLMADLDWRVLRFTPNIVSLMVGMNDSKNGAAGRMAFERELRRFVQSVRCHGGIVILHTTNVVDRTLSQSRSDLPAYNEIVRHVATSENAILVDHWLHWERLSADPAFLREWLDDPIHPNARGHLELAVQMMKELDIYDVNSRVISQLRSEIREPVAP